MLPLFNMKENKVWNLTNTQVVETTDEDLKKRLEELENKVKELESKLEAIAFLK